MQVLSYITTYMHRKKRAHMRAVSINLITNFTDDVLERVLGGRCLEEEIYPTITRAPYKQYALTLKDKKNEIYHSKPQITFVFFDASPYKHSEFLNKEHCDEVLADITSYARTVGGSVVVSLFALPYQSAYGHFFSQDPLFAALSDFNAKLRALAERMPSIHVFDTAKVFHYIGEAHARDLRGHHAFDMPFSTDFLSALSFEWLAYVRAVMGLSRKAVVLDLDNTLWGGVVGEDGPLGVKLGPEYPGVAYQNFQRTLLSLWERGIILAINSKNNEADVHEVFKKNPHMILKEEHFAAVRANWDDKSTNILSIAQELNIGLDSMVFIDDSPLERERMRLEVPHVLTPEWSFEPEQYTKELLSLNVFHQMSLTQEDKKKGLMYAQETKRKEVQASAKNIDDYIKKLQIKIQVKEGNHTDIARVAQLTQKTNQYNLTTKRYSEADIHTKIKKGALVATGEVSDIFGAYGVVIMAICDIKKNEATLDTFLMSCRVMGRGVEGAFFEHLVEELHRQNIKTLHATFISTSKNKPALSFLPERGFKKTSTKGSTQHYTLPIGPAVKKLTARKRKPILTITS